MYTSNVPTVTYTLMMVTNPYYVGGSTPFELMPAPIMDYLEFNDKDMAREAKKNILASATKGLSVIALFKED